MDKQKITVKEYYGEEKLKDIYTQILKEKFIKDYEDKIQRG